MVLQEQAIQLPTDVVSSKILQALEQSESGTVSKQDLKEAVKQVSTQNGKTVDSGSANAFVDKIFMQADSTRSGKVTRAQLRNAINANEIEASQVISESTLPATSATIESVMKQLEESASGVIRKQELQAAIQ